MSPQAEQTVGPSAPATQSLICGFLRAYMGLKKEQAVVYNQKWIIPNDDRLYLVVASTGPQKAYGTSAETAVAGDGAKAVLVEEVSISTREMITVDIASKSQEAVNRKEEVLMALSSQAGQGLCEMYALKIARIPVSFVDVSQIDGTARLNRFQIAFAVLRTRTKTSPVDFFDQFKNPALVIEP